MNTKPPPTFLAILDVGHGNSTVIRTEDGTVVIDVGLGSGLMEFLSQQDIKSIQTIFLSHSDQDHIGALVGLLSSNEVELERVVVNSDALKDTEVWRDVAYELNSAHAAKDITFEVSLVADPDALEKCGTVALEILAPNRFLAALGPGSSDRQGRRLTSNSISAVVKVTGAGKAMVLLPGDIDGIGLAHLLSDGADVEAPILVFPHHGGSPGNMDISTFVEQLCAAVKPTVVIFSIARRKHKMPNPATIDAIRAVCPDVRIVCTQLSEHCSSSLPTEDACHISDVFAAGRKSRSCCGGTIIVNLDDHTDMLPNLEQHQLFIARNAESALCHG